jgi:hypothetical protein
MQATPVDREVMWLMVTNIALAAVVIICGVIVAGAVIHELVARARRRRQYMREIEHDMMSLPKELDDHAFLDPNLGWTMADGGERIDKPSRKQE